jgi:DNA-binding GntR family transcriptional regulator
VRPIDRASPLPVYFQVALDLRRRITEGEWAEGTRMDTETALAEAYAVSRVTVRQALADLVKDDLVERRRGSGTYIRPRPRPLVYELNLTVVEHASRLRELGMSNRAEVLETGTISPPTAGPAQALGLSQDGVIAYLVRRILLDDEPAAIYRSWFDADLVPGIHRSPKLTDSLGVILAEDYHAVPVRSDYSLEVARPTSEDSALLQAASDAPLLLVTITSYLAGGRPLEYAQITWLGDRVRFHATAGEEPA